MTPAELAMRIDGQRERDEAARLNAALITHAVIEYAGRSLPTGRHAPSVARIAGLDRRRRRE